MTDEDTQMRAVRFHRYGKALEVLDLEQAEIPRPAADRVRVRVAACGLNPADWELCRGLFAGGLPRGVGLDVSGVVDAVGAGVIDVSIGDAVFGSADFANHASAGLADHAVLNHWAKVPPGLGMVEAAALPMAIVTAFHHIDCLGVAEGQTLVVHGGGTMMGFAAVQMALLRGARVIATAGETFAGQLRGFGAEVTAYGPGMVERVGAIVGGPADLVLDCAWPSPVLPDLVRIAGGDPKRVLTMTNFEAAEALGVRHSFSEGRAPRHDVLGEFAELAAEGRFTVPVARIFTLADWREAVELSLGGHAHGKLVVRLEPES